MAFLNLKLIFHIISEFFTLEIEKESDLIIARGVQAQLIKCNTALPVVEIQITIQELGMVMVELRRELGLSENRPDLLPKYDRR